jgi:hypothetical protein
MLEIARLTAKTLYGLAKLVDSTSELVLEFLERGEECVGMCAIGSVVLGRLGGV